MGDVFSILRMEPPSPVMKSRTIIRIAGFRRTRRASRNRALPSRNGSFANTEPPRQGSLGKGHLQAKRPKFLAGKPLNTRDQVLTDGTVQSIKIIYRNV